MKYRDTELFPKTPGFLDFTNEHLNDRAFLLAAASEEDRAVLEQAEEYQWLRFDNGGGLEGIVSMLAAHNAELAVQCGFTGGIGSSNAHTIDVSLKEAIQAGFVKGPRYLAGSREIVTTGEYSDYPNNRTFFMNLGCTGLTYEADGVVCLGGNSFARIQLRDQPQFRAGLEFLLHQHLGAPFRLELVEAEPSLPDMPSYSLVEANRQEALRADVLREAQANPQIQALMAQFDAQLRSVRPRVAPRP